LEPAVTTQGPVLVTGAYGLVGRPVVERLVVEGFRVIATAHRTVKPPLPAAVDVRSVDLTDSRQVYEFVTEVSPSAIVHLAAVIPPHCYADRVLARAVNVDATATLVRAAAALPSPPRFVHASSMAVYGSRNPHRFTDLLTPDTPTLASDLYGCHKLAAENIVRSSDLDWSILRLSGVITLEPLVDYGNFDAFYLGALMPDDNRCHTVDCRDVAAAFATAITTDSVRELFMIAGDDSHKRFQGEVACTNAEAMGLAALMFRGRPGDPDSDVDWYPMDWMDTARSQQVLSFQRYSSAEAYEEIRDRIGWKRRPLRAAAPLLGALMRRKAPYYKVPGRYADPWGRIRHRWGDPGPDA
jgi:nucleoside-diphosphate-sugar epimerase